MALIAWSTRTGVFDMTRTTGTSGPSRFSMKSVVIPAATETTSWSAETCGRDVLEQLSHVLRFHGDNKSVG